MTITATDYAEEPDPALSNVEYSATEDTRHGIWSFAPLDRALVPGIGWLMLGRDLVTTRRITMTQSQWPSDPLVALDADPVWLADDPEPSVRTYSRREPDQLFLRYDR